MIVYEALIDDDRRPHSFGLLMSLNMLIETPGGPKQRSRSAGKVPAYRVQVQTQAADGI